MIKRIGKRIGLAGARTAAGAVLGGPLGAAAGFASPSIIRGGKATIRGAKATRRGMKSVADQTSEMVADSRFRNSRVAGAIGRHPFRTALGVATVGSIHSRTPGSINSTRNQNDPYLRRIRSHQQSSALTGLVGNSMGGMTL